MTDKMGLPDMM